MAAAAILLVLIAGNSRLILGVETPQWDASDFFGPQFSLVSDFVKHGRLLLWDPWIAGGTPDFAEPELGTTSPLLLLVGLLSPNPQAGFIAYWLVLWAIGGIGMLRLARYLGSPPWGGLAVALGYVTSGFYTANAEHTSSICSIAFLPWILWRLDTAIQTRTYWPGIQAGVLYGLSALGGYPEFTILTPGFLTLWAIGRAVCSNTSERLREFGRTILLVALIVIVGSLICSPPYAGFLKDTHGYSDRVGPRDRNQSLGSNILPAGALSTFSSPFLYLLNQGRDAIWPVSDISMSNVYMGASALALALVALRRRQRWRLWLLLMAVFFGCCALGSQLPVRGWLYDYVPPTRYFRNASYFREYLILILAILAAYAARDLSSRDEIERTSKRFFPISIVLAAAAILTFWLVARGRGAALPEFRLALTHLVFVWWGLAILAYFLWKRPIRRPLVFRLLAVLAIADAWGTLAIDRSTISTRATQPWWQIMNSQHVRGLDLNAGGVNRLQSAPAMLGSVPSNRNLPLKVATFDNFIVFANRFHREFVSDPALNRMALGPDRFWFSAEPSWTAPSGAAFQMFRDRIHQTGVPPLLLHSTGDMLLLSSAERYARAALPASPAPCIPAHLSHLTYRPDSMAFHYSAPGAGWLMITDRWAPGWQAAVNGHAQEVAGADFIFRAIPVAAGENQVILTYRPRGHLFLLAASWGTLILFVISEIRRKWRRRKESPLEQAIYSDKIGLRHLLSNGADGNVTHPLFDEAYYLRNNPDVAASGLSPLMHYRQSGAKELRNPHALFDAKFYVAQHPGVLAENADPLVHFLTRGAKLRYNPNPYFDTDFYLWRNPEVEASGINPLVHFVKIGAAAGLDPHPLFGMKDYLARYPDLIPVGAEPLSHYLEYGQFGNRTFARPLCFSEIASAPLADARGSLSKPGLPLAVFCVYGPSNVEFIRDAVIPAFRNEAKNVPSELHFVNYRGQEALLADIDGARDWSEQRPAGHWGFGESVNYLFETVKPDGCFLLCNPDSFPMQGCLARMLETFVSKKAAIVEACQWPSAHPKEFDPETLETPWASGAFTLISSDAFLVLNGFDPVYFLYTEDVDLSWRAWLHDFRVIHQPLALCAHATGLHSYGSTRFYHEHFFSLRNFLVISYKFFAELGERIAMEYLRAAKLPQELYKKVLDDYQSVKASINVQPQAGSNTEKIKILGLNLFHDIRQ